MYEVKHFPNSQIRYKIDGIPVPGVTTCTGCIPGKADWLPAWACKEMEIYLKRMWVPGRPYIPMEIEALLKAGKAAHRQKKEKAAGSGTRAHELIERFIITGMIPAATEPLEVLNAFNLFLRWLEKNEVEWIHTELVVGSKLYMYGGRFDAIARVNGVVTLIDFKTSSGIYSEYNAQLAAYALAYEEMEKTPAIAQRMVLWIPKTGNDFKDYIVPTPLELDKRTFLAALEMYRCVEDSKRVLEGLKAVA